MGVVSNKNDIEDLKKSTEAGLDTRVTALETTVGDSESGLVKDVADLEEVVGDSSGGLVKDLSDLADVVGDSNSGLVYAVESNTFELASINRTAIIETSTGGTNKERLLNLAFEILTYLVARKSEFQGQDFWFRINYIFDGVSELNVFKNVLKCSEYQLNEAFVASNTFFTSSGNIAFRCARVNLSADPDPIGELKYGQMTASNNTWSNGDLSSQSPSGTMSASITVLKVIPNP